MENTRVIYSRCGRAVGPKYVAVGVLKIVMVSGETKNNSLKDHGQYLRCVEGPQICVPDAFINGIL